MTSPEIEQLLIFTLDERRFALKASVVERVLRAAEITPMPDAPDGVRGLINIAGKILPVYDLRSKFDLPPRDVRAGDFFVIAIAHQRTAAVLVDDLIGVMECPVIKTDELIQNGKLIEGVVKTGSELVLIHDLDAFLSVEQRESLEAGLKA